MRTERPLTEEDVLQFLLERQQEERPCPTLREIAEHVGHKTTISVQRLLDRLEERKLIVREAGKSRNIRLIGQALPPRGLPVVGQIAAGNPREAIEADEYLDVAEHYDAERHFGLRVQGDSMIDAHILDGDIAILRRQSTCENGDIVAAILDGEATLKRFFRRADHILLKPENRRLKPIRARDVQIRGVLVGLWRNVERQRFDT